MRRLMWLVFWPGAAHRDGSPWAAGWWPACRSPGAGSGRQGHSTCGRPRVACEGVRA